MRNKLARASLGPISRRAARVISRLVLSVLIVLVSACDASHQPGVDTRFVDASGPLIPADGGATMCPAGRGLCSGVCVSLEVDPLNCGVCGNQCPLGVECVAGECATFLCNETTRCDGVCRDFRNDEANCGACGAQCADSERCVEGRCACAPGTISCDGSCIDPMNDIRHCGACDRECGFGAECCSGFCVETHDAPLSCGACDARCENGGACLGTTCCGGVEICDALGVDENCNGLVNESCPASAIVRRDLLDGLACMGGTELTCATHEPFQWCSDPQNGDLHADLVRNERLRCAANEFIVGVRAVGRGETRNLGMEAICAPLELRARIDGTTGETAYDVHHGAKTARFTFGARRGEYSQNAGSGERMCPDGSVMTGLSFYCSTTSVEGYFVLCSPVGALLDSSSAEIALGVGEPQNVNGIVQGAEPRSDSQDPAVQPGRYYTYCPDGGLARGLGGIHWHASGGSVYDKVLSIHTMECGAPSFTSSIGDAIIPANDDVVRPDMTVVVSSSVGSLRPGRAAIDGDPTTYFEAASEDIERYWELDLGQYHRIAEIEVDAPSGVSYRLDTYLESLELSTRRATISLTQRSGGSGRNRHPIGTWARYVRITANGNLFQLGEVRISGQPNAGYRGRASQSSVLGSTRGAILGIDGNRGGDLALTAPEEDPYWRVELASPTVVHAARIWGPSEDFRAQELVDLAVVLRDAEGNEVFRRLVATGLTRFPDPDGLVLFPEGLEASQVELRFANPASGRTRILGFAELEVIAAR